MCSSSARSLSVLALVLTSALGVALIAAPSTVADGGGFKVVRASVAPDEAYFAGAPLPKVRYVFHSSGTPRTTTVRVVNTQNHRSYGRWTERKLAPGEEHERTWNGSDPDGGSAPDGTYAFRISSPGRRSYLGGRFTLRGYRFPISGPHGTRGELGEFGADRVDGRTHRGFDVTAPCGTDLRAIRGGEVERKGYDPELYGHFIEVDARSSPIDYFYAHLREPATAGAGDRVRTSEVLGEVGLTGNASGTPCHLHIEIRNGGRTVDPEPYLRRWDAYS